MTRQINYIVLSFALNYTLFLSVPALAAILHGEKNPAVCAASAAILAELLTRGRSCHFGFTLTAVLAVWCAAIHYASGLAEIYG